MNILLSTEYPLCTELPQYYKDFRPDYLTAVFHLIPNSFACDIQYNVCRRRMSELCLLTLPFKPQDLLCLLVTIIQISFTVAIQQHDKYTWPRPIDVDYLALEK